MQIELLLDPKAQNYADVIADLEHELRTLKGLEYKQVEAPAPPKTLNLEHDIVKLVFEHGADALRLIVVLLQLTQAVADRRKKPEEDQRGPETDEPVAILKVDDRTVTFPASDKAQRNLLDAVRKGKTKKVIRKKAKTKKNTLEKTNRKKKSRK
jgi:leucyl aminopeptidase (aminopeptidase T)